VGDVIYLKARRDADKWNGLCCDCCKGCTFWSPLLGNFPQHSTAHQFFSPGLYELYQKEGFRAYEDYKNFKSGDVSGNKDSVRYTESESVTPKAEDSVDTPKNK